MIAKLWLLKGCRWRIENGNDVSIWSDYWVPGHPPLQQYTANATVDRRGDKVAI